MPTLTALDRNALNPLPDMPSNLQIFLGRWPLFWFPRGRRRKRRMICQNL